MLRDTWMFPCPQHDIFRPEHIQKQEIYYKFNQVTIVSTSRTEPFLLISSSASLTVSLSKELCGCLGRIASNPTNEFRPILQYCSPNGKLGKLKNKSAYGNAASICRWNSRRNHHSCIVVVLFLLLFKINSLISVLQGKKHLQLCLQLEDQ